MAMMSVLALISCQVAEIAEPVQDKDFPTGAVVTLTSDESVSTRTEWNGYTIHWSQGDAVSMTCCRNGEWGTVMYESEPLAMTSAFAGFKASSFTTLYKKVTGYGRIKKRLLILKQID